ncbi:3-methyladenine DNA glycosylase [Antrihabitans cavernicola]|uniref:3-methyladenine DNA glycosylase n=1 Tax=Antrihabitans cavernicola TaxID=2495913 RepID=A0A5A7S3U2_9NOCA|nr:3-methyladenine DNA glycosylase [Spelaeibacter cavernicola]KAA0020059.1 3-methyladenine DNA glycosylase [Spelaeibacter cavernicola]
MTTRLAEPDWTARRAAHRARVAPLVEPHAERKSTGRTHPVIDFLFTYYSLRPALLRRWGPGYGVLLDGAGALDYLQYKGYREIDGGIGVDPALLDARRSTLEFVVALLAATESRPAQLGCFGLHEWAMVYRGGDADVRHSSVPLRLGHDGTDSVVESMQLRCTHYDAFRFFTPAAVQRNVEPLRRVDQLEREQPGCVHATMDLYKWGYKLGPLIDSDLLADCFDLAVDARELDMRASPYDLTEFGYSPVQIETPSGRAEYVRGQSALAERAAVLRSALLQRCRSLLAQPLPT